MGRAKALREAEKTTIIEETGRSTSPVAIAQMLGRHVKTIEILEGSFIQKESE